MSLPGEIIKLNSEVISKNYSLNTTCYKHSSVLATHRLCTESDSFGHEYLYMCKNCYNEYKEKKDQTKEEEHKCDWCNTLNILKPVRDPDEGSCGRVYYVCNSCRNRMNERLKEELEYSNQDNDYY